jgi:biopolymer transport protein ExbB/TolQ
MRAIIAIPAVMAYNIFVARLGAVTGELDGFAAEMVGTMAREGRI